MQQILKKIWIWRQIFDIWLWIWIWICLSDLGSGLDLVSRIWTRFGFGICTNLTNRFGFGNKYISFSPFQFMIPT
jgi:hypothetical protein